MHLLVLDHNRTPKDWGARELCDALHGAAAARGGVTLTVRRPEAGDLPALRDSRRWAGVVLSGSLTAAGDRSPWVLELVRWIQQWMDTQKPLLGVCFGHQMVARAAAGGAGVVADRGPREFGVIKVKQVATSRLLSEMPAEFSAASAHQDAVISIPRGWVRTAESRLCAIQAMEHEALPFYGVQFHPERKPVLIPVFERFFGECSTI